MLGYYCHNVILRNVSTWLAKYEGVDQEKMKVHDQNSLVVREPLQINDFICRISTEQAKSIPQNLWHNNIRTDRYLIKSIILSDEGALSLLDSAPN